MSPSHASADLRHRALQALQEPDPGKKVQLAQQLQADVAILSIAPIWLDSLPTALPGRPPRPMLQPHLDLPKRSPFTTAGLATLLHAVAHIEFNAINLALDAVWRFDDLPSAYYADWTRVAAEEAQHFQMLRTHLNTLDADYGDFPAHTGLWDMAEKTTGDVLARMALVPRTLEARGLDATPPMQAKLRKVGSPAALRAVDILDVILREEVGHVAIGNHWYAYLCAQRGLDPIATYPLLASRYDAPRIRGPLNLDARRRAGFNEAELQALQQSA